jgi:hypothetical protein
MLAVFLGGTFGVYALLTRGRRQVMREIRRGAEALGWRYNLQRWQGNPTAFRIEGTTHGGLSWVMTSGNTRGHDKGWTVVLGLRVEILGGEVDLAVVPRDKAHGEAKLGTKLPPRAEERVAKFSVTIASALDFFQKAEERLSGLAAFDAAYEVLVLREQFSEAPVDAALAQKILSWPTETIRPHSMLAWRDPFGFHLQARLPGPANWSTVSYLASLGEELCARVPAGRKPAVAPTFVDRAIERILEP